MFTIYLKEAILHIIDRQTGEPVLSEVSLDLANDYIREYIEKKIQKLSSPQTKAGILAPDSEVAQLLNQYSENFIELSHQLVNKWYRVYQESEEAPSCDIIIVKYEVDTIPYLAFLKINFAEGYTHFVENQAKGIENKLILHRAILANKTQKVDEGALIQLLNFEFQMIEKKYLFSGEKKSYFSTNFLEQVPAASLEENVRLIKQVASKVGKDFAEADFQVIADVKQAVAQSIEQNGCIEPETIAKEVFKENITAQLAFQEKVAEKGITSQAPLISQVKEISEKKYSKQKLVLSNGIELIIPMDVYRDPSKLEFINQPDGTISVTIKNIEDISAKL